MKTEVFYFKQDRAKEYNLGLFHLIILNWFRMFISSGKMKVKVHEGKAFYWICHSKLLDDNDYFDNIRQVRKYLSELCSEKCHAPLEKYVEWSVNGSFAYYRPTDEFAYLQGDDGKAPEPMTEEELDQEELCLDLHLHSLTYPLHFSPS